MSSRERLAEWLRTNADKVAGKRVHVLELGSMVEGTVTSLPANQLALADFVKMSKSHPQTLDASQPKEAPVADKTELEKALADLSAAEAAVATAEAAQRAADRETETLKADIRSRDRTIEDLRKQLDTEVAKHADPEEVMLEKMDPAARAAFVKMKEETAASRALIEKMSNERELGDIAKQLDADFTNLPMKGEDFAPIMREMTKTLSEEQVTEVRRILKAADEAASELVKTQSAMMHAHVPETGPEAELNKMAKERASSDNVSFEKAYSAVLKENPDLYARFLAEQAN